MHRKIRNMVALLVVMVLWAVMFAPYAHAQDATFTARSEGSITLTAGALDAVRSAVRDEIAKGINVSVRPSGLNDVREGIADLTNRLGGLEYSQSSLVSAFNRHEDDASAALGRIESMLDRLSSMPWWGWIILALAIIALIATLTRRVGQDGRDGRDGQDGVVDYTAVRNMVREIVEEERDAEDPLAVPEDALVTINVGSVGNDGSVTIGDTSVTLNGDDELTGNAVDIQVAKGGNGSTITIGKIVITTAPKPTTPPASTTQA